MAVSEASAVSWRACAALRYWRQVSKPLFPRVALRVQRFGRLRDPISESAFAVLRHRRLNFTPKVVQQPPKSGESRWPLNIQVIYMYTRNAEVLGKNRQ